ncbi:MAG: sulfatase-like hydrolase/transferase, partial [Deltaproteobacteria bacterium]|nr:sulfatase-like hydrolase/transferase [Deltaproteobacteria bacterium]
LVRLTPWQWCAAIAQGRAPADPAAGCDLDGDGDGVPRARDCDDLRADVRPGAEDQPGDGVDQDCSGADRDPYNVLVIALESHRALGVGHVTGGPSWSPRVDQLAREGIGQRRAVAAGLPTIASFMVLHTGLLPCAWCTVATDFAAARLPALPLTLRQHGYYARFFSAADPSWDNQAAWLRHWYHDVDYDRAREEDGPLFAHMAQWFKRELAGAAKGRPFFALAMTRTNHFPFARVAGVQHRGGDSWADGMRDTMHYADAELGGLLDALRGEPWFRKTLVVVTGDHGHPLGEHGHRHLFDTVQVEGTGVPLVFWGDHPKINALRGQIGTEPSSHLDIAPTVLDLLGIDRSGAWQGRSLVGGGRGQSWTIKDAMWAAERGSRRLLVDGSRHLDRSGWRAFDRTTDLREDKPLPLTDADAELAADLTAVATWMYDLYRRDRVLPVWWPVAAK